MQIKYLTQIIIGEKLTSSSWRIAHKNVGPGNPCLIIAEVAQAHDGSLGMAHAYIDAAANAGADAVKFQTHIAEAESTLSEPWRVRFSYQDDTRYNYWKRMEFSEEQWAGLFKHASDKGLIFLSSPFSLEAVELLLRVGIPAWKIASGEVNNSFLFKRLVDTKLPLLISSGMSALKELDVAVNLAKTASVPFALLQCYSAYPCPPEKIGLNMLSIFRERYECAIGLSDHSGTIYPGLAGAALGINILEVHITLSREMFGPDVVASVTTSELRQLVDGIRFIEKMIENPLDKDQAATNLQPLRDLFTKSLFYKSDMEQGTVLGMHNLSAKKPGTGIPADKMDQYIGKKLIRDVKQNDFLQESDLE